MPLSQKRIEEFAKIWEKEFGEKLSPEQARFEAERFLEFVYMIAQPLPNESGHRRRPPIESP